MSKALQFVSPSRRTLPIRLPRSSHFSGKQALRCASNSANAQKYKRSDAAIAAKSKRKASTTYRQYDPKDAVQFSLCDAIRYIRAFEVGRPPQSSKYEVAIRLKTLKSGPVVRSRLRLPHAVDTSVRICVICDPNSKQGNAAKAAGAVLIGEETVFAQIKEGRIEFDRCICHADSLKKLSAAGLGRILGPRGLMPSAKLGTVVKDVGSATKELVGGSEYRERAGVIRLAIGQLGFTPEEIQRNIRAFMETLKKDCAVLSDRISKEVHEVVLSSTNSPGFILNGTFRGPESVPTPALATL